MYPGQLSESKDLDDLAWAIHANNFMSITLRFNFTAALLGFALSAVTAKGENWPQWRGPQGNGTAPAGKYLTSFSAGSGVLWKVELPGKGSSTPAVWGENIFVTAPIDFEDGVLCLDWDGNEKWRQSLGKERAGKTQESRQWFQPFPHKGR